MNDVEFYKKIQSFHDNLKNSGVVCERCYNTLKNIDISAFLKADYIIGRPADPTASPDVHLHDLCVARLVFTLYGYVHTNA